MKYKATKLRWRRVFRKRRRQVEDIGEQTDQLAEKLFFRRLNRLVDVRRFVFTWVLLLIILGGITIAQTRALSTHFQNENPVPGGTFTEGIVGSFTNANPMYATGAVDNAVSHLIFASLLKYNTHNQLVGDLAESWTVDERGVTYTVVLRKGVLWHDGRPVTSEDVVFTYQTIQQPDAKSPLLNSWRGIKVEARDAQTVVFTLPSALSSFPHSLINGIVPKHLLDNIPYSQLRSVRFNNASPVGTGPFKWSTIEVTGTTPETREESVGLVANESYYAGSPKLDGIIIRAFREEKNLVDTFMNNELDAVSGLDSMPEQIEARQEEINEYSVPLTGQMNVFFKTSQGLLSEQKVRQGLIRAVDMGALIAGLDHPVIVTDSPLLQSHVGYNKDIVQLPYEVNVANQLLDEAGWPKGADGIRRKGEQALKFKLFAEANGENTYITQYLQKAWREVGADVEVVLQPLIDLQSTATDHAYDAMLYAIALGPDPDVYPYWHSSQITNPPKLNFSEYKSATADKSLEEGRTRADNSIRAVKYQPLLTAWSQDAPALSLFQPRFLYYSHDKIHGFDVEMMNTAIDRFANIENWMIRTGKVNK